MNVGLALPQFDYPVPGQHPLPWQTVLGSARRAEELGFGSVWLADHLFMGIEKYGAAAGPHPGYDPLPVLGALARATERVRLGTLVLCVPMRPPAVVAKALATLDVLSGGRLTVGLGAGWHEPEFAAAGVAFEPFEARLQRLAEAAEILAGLFTGDEYEFTGRHYRLGPARCLPVSLQRPRPPIWIGGRGDRLLDVVARHGDGWNTVWAWTPEEYRERLGVLGAACERAGRDPAAVELSVGLFALVGEDRRDLARRFGHLRRNTPDGVLDGYTLDEWRRGRLVGTVEEVRAQLEEWASIGVSTLIAGVGAIPFAAGNEESVEALAAALP